MINKSDKPRKKERELKQIESEMKQEMLQLIPQKYRRSEETTMDNYANKPDNLENEKEVFGIL